MANTAEAGDPTRARRWLAAVVRVQAAVLLTLVYWIFLGPAALAARLLGADLLARRRPAKSGWIPRPARGARETLDGAG